jgi:hypothetical protein
VETEIREIFESITEHHTTPLRLSSKCETTVYYRVEDLTLQDIEICAEYIAERVFNVCHPQLPQILIHLPGSYTGLTETLSRALGAPDEPLDVMTYAQVEAGNGCRSRLKNASVMLVNDVITTARSCLAAHTQITMMGATVLCWGALIDRTFGPGPVPVITAYTGEPVTLIGEIP